MVENFLDLLMLIKKIFCYQKMKIYTYLNAKFQRITKRDKKAFLSNQCKEIKENNRMGKTSDLFKKIRHIKGTFQASKRVPEKHLLLLY